MKATLKFIRTNITVITFLLTICFVNPVNILSQKGQTIKSAEKEIAKKQKAKAKAKKKADKEAKKHQWKMQSKATRKRMKKNNRRSKKARK